MQAPLKKPFCQKEKRRQVFLMLILQSHNFHHSFFSFNVMVTIISLGKTAGKKNNTARLYSSYTIIRDPACSLRLRTRAAEVLSDGWDCRQAGRRRERVVGLLPAAACPQGPSLAAHTAKEGKKGSTCC